MADEAVIVENRGAWTLVTLNRPQRLNSFNAALGRSLAQALERLSADPSCRAVLLTGAGRGFCAGQDLMAIDEMPSLDMILRDLLNPVIRLIRAMPKPVVCAVNGVAAGAGANLALACDIVLAARSAQFIQAFSKIGLVPDCGGTWFLPRLVGEARARALAITGEPTDAETAAHWGMIWKAVDDVSLKGEAEALTERLAAGSTAAVSLIKQAFDGSALNDLHAQLDMEADLQAQAGAGPDFREGVSAFTEKRPPRFTAPAPARP